MKNLKAIVLMLMLAMVAGTVSAQTKHCASKSGKDIRHDIPIPHKNVRPSHRTKSCDVSYDEASTILMVNFPSNSQGGIVEVFHDGAQVAGATSNGGTTFCCILRDYGTGNYTVIVYNGNTVIDNENCTVR